MNTPPSNPSTNRNTAATPNRAGRPALPRLPLAAALAALALVLFTPPLVARLNPNAYTGGRSERQQDILERNSSFVALLLGEFRAGMSDLLFIKTERYLHAGVAYQPHLDLRAMESSGRITHARTDEDDSPDHDPLRHGPMRLADIQHFVEEDDHDHSHDDCDHDHDHEHHHEYADTIVRAPDQDFRGFIGYLERQVKPWLDPNEPHIHGDGAELLPWFRLQTISDPRNVRAYLIGSWWLKTKGGVQVEEALRYTDEGIRNNPGAFQLHLMRGSILRLLDREPESIVSFEKAAELGIAARPPGGDENPHAERLGWDFYKEEDLRMAARMTVLLEKKYDNRDKALELARRYSPALDSDAVLDRQIRYLTGLEPDPMDAPPSDNDS